MVVTENSTDVHSAVQSSPSNSKNKKMVWTQEWKEQLLRLMEIAEITNPSNKMKALKELWDQKFIDFKHISKQALWDSARKFRKSEIPRYQGNIEQVNEVSATRLEANAELAQGKIEISNKLPIAEESKNIETKTKQRISNQNEMPRDTFVVEEPDENANVETSMAQQISNQNEMPSDIFVVEGSDRVIIEAWAHVLLSEFEKYKNCELKFEEEPRRPLKKIKMRFDEIEIMNKVVQEWGLPLINNLLDVSNMLYAVGKTMEFLKSDGGEHRINAKKVKGQKSCSNRNRALRQLDKAIKDNKRIASWAECEMQRRRERRKATKREIYICQKLLMEVKTDNILTTAQLKELKLKCTDSIHALQVRIKAKEKTILRRKNNSMFEAEEKKFYRNFESVDVKGKAPEVEDLHAYWSGI